MSSDIRYFDVEERQTEKACARDEDEARIAADPSARAGIARRNGMFLKRRMPPRDLR